MFSKVYSYPSLQCDILWHVLISSYTCSHSPQVKYHIFISLFAMNIVIWDFVVILQVIGLKWKATISDLKSVTVVTKLTKQSRLAISLPPKHISQTYLCVTRRCSLHTALRWASEVLMTLGPFGGRVMSLQGKILAFHLKTQKSSKIYPTCQKKTLKTLRSVGQARESRTSLSAYKGIRIAHT